MLVLLEPLNLPLDSITFGIALSSGVIAYVCAKYKEPSYIRYIVAVVLFIVGFIFSALSVFFTGLPKYNYNLLYVISAEIVGIESTT